MSCEQGVPLGICSSNCSLPFYKLGSSTQSSSSCRDAAAPWPWDVQWRRPMLSIQKFPKHRNMLRPYSLNCCLSQSIESVWTGTAVESIWNGIYVVLFKVLNVGHHFIQPNSTHMSHQEPLDLLLFCLKIVPVTFFLNLDIPVSQELGLHEKIY